MSKGILILADCEKEYKILSEVLNDKYKVIRFDNSSEALGVLHKNYMSISAVLFVIHSGQTNDFSCLSQINNDTDFSKIPVVVITDTNDESVMSKLWGLGVSQILTKPISVKDVEYCLRNIIAVCEKNSKNTTFQQNELTGEINHKTEYYKSELIDNIPYGVILYNYDGENLSIAYINKRYRKLVEREPGNCEDISAFDEIHPDDVYVIKREIESAIRDNRDIACDIRIKHGDDGYRSFHVEGTVIKNTDGSYSFYAAYIPISDGVMSFHKIHSVALSTMLESSTDLSYIKDKDFRYVSCSRTVAKTFGLKNEKEIIGKTDYDLFNKSLADKFRADDVKVLESGEPLIDKIESVPGDNGTARYANTSKYPILNSSGQVIGIYCISYDITERRENKSKLKLLTDSIPGGLASFEISQNGLKTVYFNDGFYNFSGYSREEFVKLSSNNPFFLAIDEDRKKLFDMINSISKNRKENEIMSCVYRCKMKNGRLKWFNLKCTLSEAEEGKSILNVVQIDITEQKNTEENLQMSKEAYRLAMKHSGTTICRYNISDRALTIEKDDAKKLSIPEYIEDIPFSSIREGKVSSDTAEDYIKFYESINSGDKEGTVMFRYLMMNGWRWLNAHFSTIFDDNNKPVSAIISYIDVTEQNEKEAVFKKWQQSLNDKPYDSYTLFHCDLSKNSSFDSSEGSLISITFNSENLSFDECTKEFAKRNVYKDDRDEYIELLKYDKLIGGYYRGVHTHTIDFREILPNNEVRWLNCTVELVERHNSTDIIAYLMFENIDDDKRAELQTKALAQTDPLTGLFNRKAFAEKVDAVLSEPKSSTVCALLLLDLDGFKLVNDNFGHMFGDETLVEIAKTLKSLVRSKDFVCRLGGDEFMVFLRDIPNHDVIRNKAEQICAHLRKDLSYDIEMSTSLGIAITPDGGNNFEELYSNADNALYKAKEAGKNCYRFHGDNEIVTEKLIDEAIDENKKHRILVFENNKDDRAELERILNKDFIIDCAGNGNDVIIDIRRHGKNIRAIIFGMHSQTTEELEMFKKIYKFVGKQPIPIIVLTDVHDRKTNLKVIEMGAADSITKPVDFELLKLRIRSLIRRSGNNGFNIKHNEILKYMNVIRHLGIIIVEVNTDDNNFVYDASVSDYLAGTYDNRPIWDIFNSENISDYSTVEWIKNAVGNAQNNDNNEEIKTDAYLVTPSGKKCLFGISVYKNDESDTIIIMIQKAGV